MEASILSISTAVPAHAFTQEEVAERIIQLFALDSQKSKDIRQLYQKSAIHRRYFVCDDFKKDRKDWNFWGSDFPKIVPGMTQRNDLYKQKAPQLAYEAAEQAIKNWGGDPQALTHIISVSCTGMMAPGIEFELMRSLKLNRSIQRLGINFMGCFGAFKGLAVAEAIAKEDPKHRILLVCTELCSLHFQADLTTDNILGSSLFADGAAAVIVGAGVQSQENALWTINKKASFGMDNTMDKMTWEASDTGYLMKLSYTIPVLLLRQVKSFVQNLVDSTISDAECDWAIHPGGKSIIQAVERALKLNTDLTQASWHILSQYGNMSSASFLFVLDELLKRKSSKKWIVGLGFGPGLSVEGILLKS